MVARRDDPADPHAGHLQALGGGADDEEVGALVVGLPVHNDGREGDKAREARAFGAWLAAVTGLPVTFCDVADLGRMVPSDAPHQGLVAEVDPLDDVWLGDILADNADNDRPILLLDQVTDP
ncbi:MAG: Holliday junction resolvase RuvX, partial [Akkermansiaceae bacterium]|nr:Holliday junction resolvase RuvX [Akkermansiaceae bacterium]